MKKTAQLRANKTTKPMTNAQKQDLDIQRLTANKSKNVIWHKRSKLQPDADILSPVKATKDVWHSSTTDQDQEVMRQYQTHEGAWNMPKVLEDKQPMSGPGIYMTKKELGVMPEDTLGTADRQMNSQIPVKATTTFSPIKKGTFNHIAKKNGAKDAIVAG